MHGIRFYVRTSVLVALLLLPLRVVRAEVNTSVIASGNNVGFQIMSTGSAQTFSGPHQYPAGSGNIISTSRWVFNVECVRDLDGNGSIEDTTVCQSGGLWMRGYMATPEAEADLYTEFLSGIEMKLAAGKTYLNQVWSSLDKDDLDVWPLQFREGRSASGTPITHGAETIATFSSDVWIPAELGSGASLENQFYFLNFGISSDMVFGHTRLQNMSEYLKWNRDISDLVANTPNGQTWQQWQLNYQSRLLGFGSGGSLNTGWAYYPGKDIIVQLDADGTDAGFTGGNTPFVAYKLLTPPSSGGRSMTLNNIQVRRNSVTTYGFAAPPDLTATGRPTGPIWNFGLGVGIIGDLYSGQINPFTGELASGWPGTLRGTRFEDRWVFGHYGRDLYVFYGVLDDFAPRDTTSFDYAFMFVTPASPPAILPPNELSGIDDPDFQAQLAPVEDYANAAEVILSSNYSLPGPPVPPSLTIVPGDRQVSITWSDINLSESDPYYAFLRDNPGLDPESIYREKDFEGYRLYRSYVGPNDSHSELIWESSLSAADIKFSYIDRLDDDERQRMRNGLRVWYALVPFDRNYDPATGDEFSLPDPGVSKIWYGSPQNGLYTVIPRSDASNYRAATPSVSFVSASETVAPLPFLTAVLRGNGTGAFLDDPAYLQPPAAIDVQVALEEKITQDMDLYLKIVNLSPHGQHGARRHLQLLNAAGAEIDGERTFPARIDQDDVDFLWNGPVDSDGQLYTVSSAFSKLNGYSQGEPYSHIALGTYTGADAEVLVLPQGEWGLDSGQPFYAGLMRCGAFEITWKDASGGNLTLEVLDRVHGIAVPFSPFIDTGGWGFLPVGADDYQEFRDQYGIVAEEGPDNEEVPEAERTALLTQTIPAANTESFGLWLNGQAFQFSREGGVSMPAAGVKFTVTTAFGNWNDDMTQFTQYAAPPFLGDTWQIHITGSSLNPEDADLSKINVVPNPYIASSFLDIGPASRRLEFVNLPGTCTIRIYSLGGVLVNVLNHVGSNRLGWGNYTDWDNLNLENEPKAYTGWDNHGGTEPWNLRNRFGQLVASGLYFYHVTDSRGETITGKFYVIN